MLCNHVGTGTTSHEAKSSGTTTVQLEGFITFPSPLSCPTKAMAAEAFEGPDVLRFDVAEQVVVAALCQHPEKGFAGGIPAIFDMRDGQKGITDLKQAR
jgi:hypothetical protein